MPVLWGACPTLLDPTQAPGGRRTAFMWVKTPYHLELDAQEHGRALLDLWTEFAPNLAEGAVLNSFARAPREIAVKLPNMRYGDLGRLRPPLPRFGTLPVGGLYLCGGSTHPGGNITGLYGYNAASVIAADLGLPVWWNPPDVEAALQSL